MLVCDHIAEWIGCTQKIGHVFGIIGAGNCAIFDAIHRLGLTEIVCCHHEQACVMAANAYYRTSGQVTCAILTTGGGAANGITGVVAAHMDSIPVMVISGNEHSKYKVDGRRAWGVQGFDVVEMVQSVTKMAARVMQPNCALNYLENGLAMSVCGRPGPIWLDFPMDVQKQECEQLDGPRIKASVPKDYSGEADIIGEALEKAERPVFWLGNGIRLAGGAHLAEKLLNEYRVPTILSWSAADLLDSHHPLVFGRAGVYGQRCANFVVQNADLIVAIGTRLALPQTGYDASKFAPKAKLAVCDVDPNELKRWQPVMFKEAVTVQADAKQLIEALVKEPSYYTPRKEWIERCVSWKIDYPWIEPKAHPSLGKVNSYRFMEELQKCLKPDSVIVTDMGAALLSAHQALAIKPPQRLFTSQGLGEMGCGLPFAVGASFARDKGEVICLTTDGGMMMNLQELQTIRHHNLPIKIVIFDNRGYGMIKQTQDGQYQGRRVGVDAATGVSFPDYAELLYRFGLPVFKLDSKDIEAGVKWLMAGPASFHCCLIVEMSPDQKYLPKVMPIYEDGVLTSPGLEHLSPPLPKAVMKREMR